MSLYIKKIKFAYTFAFLFLLISFSAFAGRINTNQVLFGIEYTFQDQEMVNEPGRMTVKTPHKEFKMNQMLDAYLPLLGLNRENNISNKSDFKLGWFIQVPGEGTYVINMEPVTVEFNTTPKKLDEIIKTSEPIFAAAQAANLVPYVNPAAERSGMGHVHVGGKTLAESPFYIYPNLLRNIMVYLHKNPSLLHGFAEAFDIGVNSNIETYHQATKQAQFQAAVAEFDKWYQSNPNIKTGDGLKYFLTCLRNQKSSSSFFQHYRYINLEHLSSLTLHNFTGEETGKFTVEFRNLRPPKSPQHAEAVAKLLVAIMELQSDPDRLEPFKWISDSEYLRFNASTVVESNWREVRQELKLKNNYLDEMVKEYSSAVSRFSQPSKKTLGVTIRLAHSPKDQKGQFYELIIPKTLHPNIQSAQIGSEIVELHEVNLSNRTYYIGVVSLPNAELTLDQLINTEIQFVKKPILSCKQLFH